MTRLDVCVLTSSYSFRDVGSGREWSALVVLKKRTGGRGRKRGWKERRRETRGKGEEKFSGCSF